MGDEENFTNKIQFENNIITCPAVFFPREGGLGYEYFIAMKKHKFKIAQYIADTDESDTFSSLLTRCIRTAIYLKSKGIEKDDIVCLNTNNHKNSCVPLIASLFLNLRVCSLDPTISQSDTTHLIKQIKPKLFFVTPEVVELVENSLNEASLEGDIIVFGETSEYVNFDEFIEEEMEDEETFKPEKCSSIKDTAIIFFSSGTTGLPKGVCQNHHALIAQSMNMINNGNITSVTLSYSSLYWISGVLFLTGSILSGTARIICTHFDPYEFWHIIDKYKVSLVFFAPNQALDICKVGRPDNIDSTNLNCALTGGAAMSEKQINELREILPGTFVSQAYGQTEVAGILTIFKSNDVKDTLSLHYKSESCGMPVTGITYKVVDLETDKICGPLEKGELQVKTDFAMNGYFNQDSKDAYAEGGWLRTGDVVYYDQDFCFYVVDRIKEMLKYRSWHVAPAALEGLIHSHPSVNKVVVIGIPHEEDGDHPMALIVLNDNYSNTTEEEIENFVAERVDDRQKLRGGVKFITDIPLTPSGKIRRKYLRSLVLEGNI